MSHYYTQHTLNYIKRKRENIYTYIGERKKKEKQKIIIKCMHIAVCYILIHYILNIIFSPLFSTHTHY